MAPWCVPSSSSAARCAFEPSFVSRGKFYLSRRRRTTRGGSQHAVVQVPNRNSSFTQRFGRLIAARSPYQALRKPSSQDGATWTPRKLMGKAASHSRRERWTVAAPATGPRRPRARASGTSAGPIESLAGPSIAPRPRLRLGLAHQLRAQLILPRQSLLLPWPAQASRPGHEA